ncbi:hypothetical protein P3T73_10020 [Kiritimatiellota bacterium B12222]|nr:hypothetical protein P3T73_10020 [Kiritimatiellota bacterium B12222]
MKMKKIFWMTTALTLGFFALGKDEDEAEAKDYTPLVFELSWYDAGASESGGIGFKDIEDQGYFSFATPVPLVEVAEYYIKYFSEDGWEKIGDYPKLKATNEGWDWGGVYGKGGILIYFSCHGSWAYGVMAEDGNVKSYGINRINIRILKGDVKNIFGRDPKLKKLNPDDLNEYLEKEAKNDPNSKARWEADQVGRTTANIAHKTYLEQYEMMAEWERLRRMGDNDPGNPFSSANDSFSKSTETKDQPSAPANPPTSGPQR